MRSGKYQHWDKKGVPREDGNLGQSFLNLGKLFNLLLLVGLAEKCSGTFPRRSSCMKHPSLLCLTLLTTLGEGWVGSLCQVTHVRTQFPGPKSQGTLVCLWFCNVLGRVQGKRAVREEN